MNEIKRILEQIKKAHNRKGRPEFEGYSPAEMHHIVYNTFGEGSPLHLAELPAEDYRKIPIWNQVRYLMKMIDREGEINSLLRDVCP